MPGFDEESLKRVSDVVRRVEGMPVGSIPPASGPRSALTAKTFVVTVQITAMSGAVPGHGKGIMQNLVDVSGTKTYQASTHPAIDLYNITSSQIKVGSYIKCSVVDGCWHYDVTDCGNGV